MLKKILIASFVLWLVIGMSRPSNSRVYETVYGDVVIQEKILIDLIEHPVFQRLKKIHQYGVGYYINDHESYSRYDHSMGVFYLLRTKGLPIKEQIAGLLHDVSHTAFSHFGDYFFNHNSLNNSYGDTIHTWFLDQSGLVEVLRKYGLSAEDVEPSKEKFPALEQDLPHLCADRIDYNLQGAFLRGDITRKEMMEIFDDLQFDGEKWSFSRVDLAEKLSAFPMKMTFECWGSVPNYFGNIWLTKALKIAIRKGIFSLKDINLGNDQEIWDFLIASKDPDIQCYMRKIKKVNGLYQLVQKEEDVLLSIKFRGIDPWIRISNKRLSEILPNYLIQFNKAKELANSGWKIRMTERDFSDNIVDNIVETK
ncbi:MAG: HD domain-containing protein [Parachlamydiales bacterium]|nr:HD domain-containing protein [Parachlamydiales bacterium]